MPTPATRNAILVAGMHRSGTSALARVVNLLGAHIGEDMAPAAPANPRGYWEDRRVVQLNEECLAHFDLAWDAPEPLPLDWLDTPWLSAWSERLAEHLQEIHGASRTFVIKDPRISRLLPAWIRVLARLDVNPHLLFAVRDPRETVLSLARRDGMDPARASLLWLVHVLAAERDSRGIPRAFVAFDELLKDWGKVARQAEERMGFAWPREPEAAADEVAAFLNPHMRHAHAALPEPALPAPLAQLAATVAAYARVECHTSVPTQFWDAARDALSMVRRGTSAGMPIPAAAGATWSALSSAGLGHWDLPEALSGILQPRLYFRGTDEAIDETRHVARVVPTASGRMHVRFELPAETRADFIRFDPAMRGGCYRILQVSINGQPIRQPTTLVSAAHERLLQDDDAVIAIFSSNDDPHVEFDLRSLAVDRAAPLVVDLDFECDSLFSRLAREAARLRQAGDTLLAGIAEQVEHAARDAAANSERSKQAAGDLARLLEAARAGAQTARGRTLCRLADAGWLQTGTSIRAAPVACAGVAGLSGLEILEESVQQGSFYWRSSKAEAALRLAPPRGRSLRRGWYLLRMRIQTLGGSLPRPTVRAGHELIQHAMPGSRERILFWCAEDIPTVDFLPGVASGDVFLLSMPSLRPINRWRALALVAPARVRLARRAGMPLLAAWRACLGAVRKGGVAQLLIELAEHPGDGSDR